MQSYRNIIRLNITIMVKYKIHILNMWIATCALLLSTIILHHHHLGQVCFIEQQCEYDGNINDEHTAHHEKDNKGCNIHQMHQFISNGKNIKSIYKHLDYDRNMLVALLPSSIQLTPCYKIVISKWQQKTMAIKLGASENSSLRGPPFSYFISLRQNL